MDGVRCGKSPQMLILIHSSLELSVRAQVTNRSCEHYLLWIAIHMEAMPKDVLVEIARKLSFEKACEHRSGAKNCQV